MQKLLRKQRQFRLLKKVTKKLQKLARLERDEEKQSKKARQTFWKFTHWSIAVIVFDAIVFSYGTFFPNTVSISKIQHTQHHEYYNKLDSKLDKIAIQNKKNLEEELLIELHQPEFAYNDLDTFIYAVRQCVDFINYTTPPGKRIPGSIIIAMAGIESGWGTSRFSIEGNNLFGIRTWDLKKPHMKPRDAPEANFGLKKYETKCDSIKDMIRVLNTHTAYTEFRIERSEQVKDGKWNYTRLLLYLSPWSTNPDYTTIILRTINERELP